MKANDSLERGIADVYEHEAPMRAPDWVLASALDTIEVTPQRRVLIRAPWRYTQMNTFAKVAIAAVVVLAVGAVGLSVLGPRSSSGVGGEPSASPSPSLSPAPSSPSPSTDQSAPPPLSSTFTSTMHGFSIAYPTGWVTDPATEPMKAPGLSFPSPDMDWIYDGEYQADLFLALGSQPVGVTAPDAWIADFLNSFDDGCSGHRVPISVDGTNGIICGGNLFASTAGGRGYFVRIYTGSDLPPESQTDYEETWFRSVLATMQFHPEDALDAPVSSAPASS